MRSHRTRKSLALHAAQQAAFALLCLLLWSNPATAQGGPSGGTSSHASMANSDFAIADFDGDRKPDLATVETGTLNSSGDTRYSIRFELSSGLAQAFGVTAPAGGLQIVAKDVNGDNALDLLVSTAWQHKQIAVFLNDGHGHFVPADLGLFPVANPDAATLWNGKNPSYESGILIRSEDSSNGVPGNRRLEAAQRQMRLGFTGYWRVGADLLAVFVLGRAPPFFVLTA